MRKTMNILLTGTTGYIGKRLKLKLLEDPSLRLRVLVRNGKKVSDDMRNLVDIVEGDT